MCREQTLIKSIIRNKKSGKLVWAKNMEFYTANNGYVLNYQYQHQMLYIGDNSEFYINHPFNQHLIDAIQTTVELDNDTVLDNLVGEV